MALLLGSLDVRRTTNASLQEHTFQAGNVVPQFSLSHGLAERR